MMFDHDKHQKLYTVQVTVTTQFQFMSPWVCGWSPQRMSMYNNTSDQTISSPQQAPSRRNISLGSKFNFFNATKRQKKSLFCQYCIDA